jgi:predicted dehydrogenase
MLRKEPAKSGEPRMLQGAISGFGAVAMRAHLPGWKSRPGINIVAVHDPLPQQRESAVNLIRDVRVYDDFEQMLSNETLDFVDIASPPESHAVAARLALQAGVNAIVEKPLCLSTRELHELTKLGRRCDRSVLCVHNWKYSPVYQRLHELVKAGVLGEIQYVSLTRMRSKPAMSVAGKGRQWRLDADAGGGILIDHGWHCFYLAQWLMGGDRPVAVSSYLRTHDPSGVDDLADLRIHFSGSRLVNVLLTWDSPVRRNAAVIVGSSGLIEVEDALIRIREASGRRVEYSVSDGPDDSYHPQWFKSAAADFEQVLNQGPYSEFARTNLQEAATALAVTMAARKSAAQNGSLVVVENNE